jgi:hypothetical protein
MKNGKGKEVTPQQVGDTFARLLRESLTTAQFAEVIRRNAVETNPNICHSHDFCDANMVMADAMMEYGIEIDGDNENGCAFWNAAWDHAAVAHLGRKVQP